MTSLKLLEAFKKIAVEKFHGKVRLKNDSTTDAREACRGRKDLKQRLSKLEPSSCDFSPLALSCPVFSL